MKTKKYIGLMMMAAGMLAASSCSDFDDYNTVKSDVTSSANQTLWENISSNSELSDFAAIVKKAGFSDELSASSFYTVWAPLNGTYDASAFLAEDSSQVLKEFVKQHIANYNYPASGTIDENVLSLNLKKHTFTGSGTYTYQDVPTSQINLPSKNGVMHVLNGYAPFYFSLYEYLSKGENIDSLNRYFKKYEYSYLDTKKSVVGPVVNGKQTYTDSVMVTNNLMYKTLNAQLDEEDSSYTFIMPTNKAWNSCYNRIKAYYKYAGTTNYNTYSNNEATATKVTVNTSYLTDSLTKRGIVDYLTFSNTIPYNKSALDGSIASTDTLYTTTRHKLSNPAEILAQASNKAEMSNGYARVTDSIASYSWETYAPYLDINAYQNTVAFVSGSSSRGYWTATDPNTGESNTTSYIWIKPSSNYAYPTMTIQLPNVLSTIYNIYCVIIPSHATVNGTTQGIRPNYLKFDLAYANASGVLKTTTLNTKLSNDTSKVDTMLVGQFTYPVAYKGLGSGVCPTMTISSAYKMTTKIGSQYCRDLFASDLRIAAVILRPVEYDEFLKTEK